jgi:hypothetical protein
MLLIAAYLHKCGYGTIGCPGPGQFILKYGKGLLVTCFLFILVDYIKKNEYENKQAALGIDDSLFGGDPGLCECRSTSVNR